MNSLIKSTRSCVIKAASNTANELLGLFLGFYFDNNPSQSVGFFFLWINGMTVMSRGDVPTIPLTNILLRGYQHARLKMISSKKWAHRGTERETDDSSCCTKSPPRSFVNMDYRDVSDVTSQHEKHNQSVCRETRRATEKCLLEEWK